MPDKVELSIEQLADLYAKALAEADQSPIADGWTVQEIIADFYAWLHDDVKDLEPGDETIEISFESEVINPDGSVTLTGCKLVTLEDTPNLTGFGDIVPENENYEEDWLNEELNATSKNTDVVDWAAKRRQYIHRLRADSAMGYLRALNAEEDSDIANS